MSDELQFERVDAESVQLEGTTITVGRLVHAPASKIFAVLSDPAQHVDLDPKGLNRAPDGEAPERITEVGQQFTLNMYAESQGGDYRITNNVTKFEEDVVIGWKPQSEGYDKPFGHQWTWELEPEDEESTYVSLTYDWDDITNEKFLANTKFPIFPIDSFKASVEALAELVEDDYEREDDGDWDDELEDEQ
ncbi:SRPBCC family protein [Gulosibacter molinativorax]|uniref:Polyketide cyclase n=1 Tax=Gulosibacter molinativorax TaxID=256821 RepID=A0ABT7CB89_9MICO|nr:SRPBCC family protein [Gulosibacter molinativorax]MDJ1372468.1 polyketide cyclase [Gulosibacter molinativorax]QUY63522.1 Hypotetical protein [Gulosibacter molinativorax]